MKSHSIDRIEHGIDAADLNLRGEQVQAYIQSLEDHLSTVFPGSDVHIEDSQCFWIKVQLKAPEQDCEAYLEEQDVLKESNKHDETFYATHIKGMPPTIKRSPEHGGFVVLVGRAIVGTFNTLKEAQDEASDIGAVCA